MRLFLVRHGETPANLVQSLDTDAPGPELTAKGLGQAAALPGVFADVPIDAMWATTLVRTQLTATPLARDRALRFEVLDELREVEAGVLERRTDAEAHAAYHDAVDAWLHGDLARAVPGGPSGYDFLARYDRGLAAVAASAAETAVVVSHGTAIRYWCGLRVDGVTPEFAATAYVPNTGVVELDGGPGAWRLVSWIARSGDSAGDGSDLAAAPVRG